MYSKGIKYFFRFAITKLLFSVVGVYAMSDEINDSKTVAKFVFTDSSETKFPNRYKEPVKKIAISSIAKIRKLMPGLDDSINFTIKVTALDLSKVYGVTGRADKPTEIEIILSSSYKGGLDDAIEDGLEATLLHELHHTIRGWTIYGNRFGQGIDIAAINEGLADVFAEVYSGHPQSNYSKDVDCDLWVKEILALPKNANYGDWMFVHPDGRESIGYRTGNYLIKKAMNKSGKDILELSKLPVQRIYELAGYHK